MESLNVHTSRPLQFFVFFFFICSHVKARNTKLALPPSHQSLSFSLYLHILALVFRSGVTAVAEDLTAVLSLFVYSFSLSIGDYKCCFCD